MSSGSPNFITFIKVIFPAAVGLFFVSLASNTNSFPLKHRDSSQNSVHTVKSQENFENGPYEQKDEFEFMSFDTAIPSSWEDLDEFKVVSESSNRNCKVKMSFRLLNYDEGSVIGCLFKDTRMPHVLAEVR
jgi:hypothetical protein